jgi:hypothetical protein
VANAPYQKWRSYFVDKEQTKSLKELNAYRAHKEKAPDFSEAFAPLDIETSNQIIESLKRIYNLRYLIKLW